MDEKKINQETGELDDSVLDLVSGGERMYSSEIQVNQAKQMMKQKIELAETPHYYKYDKTSGE